MLLLWILLLCLACGAFFAYIAAWLTTKRGNTISDILKARDPKDQKAIEIDILEKVKIASNLPIVALYVVAFAVAILLPAFISWQMLKDVCVITLSGEVKSEPNTKVYVMSEDSMVARSGSLTIPILYKEGIQKFNIEGDYYPITLQIYLSKLKNTLSISIAGHQEDPEIPLDLETKAIRLQKPIVLTRIPGTQPAPVSNTPSEPRPVNPEFKNIGSPLEGRE